MYKHSSKSISQKELEHVYPGHPNFHETVFKRHATLNWFKVGERVRDKRSGKTGTITRIIDNLKEVLWELNSPKYIYVQFDDGLSSVYSFRELTYKGTK